MQHSTDVDNFQILGHGEGIDEEEAFASFLRENKWVFDTDFKEIICIEVKKKIFEGKRFILGNSKTHIKEI
ncbi:MAG: hypothetical protein DRN35_05635 [Thermoplasmata archaeon]|nr:MAG: hypothetical protein DRN35_05635 [Thermoplasmata archaeon]